MIKSRRLLSPLRRIRPFLPGAGQIPLPILMYHHLVDLAPDSTPVWRSVSVRPEAFERQVRYLATHGFDTLSFSDLVAHLRDGRPLPQRSVILTFDDGWPDAYTVAYPVLRQYHMVGVFFVLTNSIDQPDGTRLSARQMQEMSAGGMEFGSHTIDHPFLTRLAEDEVERQLRDSKAALERLLDKPVEAFAYPYGDYSGELEAQVARAGYRAAVTARSGIYQPADGLLRLRRMGIPYWYDDRRFAAMVDWLPRFTERLRPLVRA